MMCRFCEVTLVDKHKQLSIFEFSPYVGFLVRSKRNAPIPLIINA